MELGRELIPRSCGKCQGMGRRGMDNCNICGTTGEVFQIGDKVFPNTKEGYFAARDAQRDLVKAKKPIPAPPAYDSGAILDD